MNCGSCNETPRVSLPPLVSGTNSSSCVSPTAEEWAELAMSRMPGTDGDNDSYSQNVTRRACYTGWKVYLRTVLIRVFHILTLTKGVLQTNKKQKTRFNLIYQ